MECSATTNDVLAQPVPRSCCPLVSVIRPEKMARIAKAHPRDAFEVRCQAIPTCHCERHEHRSMTGHYSVAQIQELVAALEAIADENGRANKTLQMLRLEAKKSVVA